jgi:hypothetical protein
VPTPLIDAWQDWACPACQLTERTRPLPPDAARFHTCPGLHMLTAPLVRAGTDCTLIAIERQDSLNGEIQATGDDGLPYMAVSTVYADGHNDLLVNAGAARMHLGEGTSR